MFWIVLIGMVTFGATLGFWMGRGDGSDYYGRPVPYSTVGGIIGAIIGGAVLYGIFSFGHWMNESDDTDYKTTYELRQLELGEKEKEGNYDSIIFIASGNFGEKGYYYYYVKNPDGTIQLHKTYHEWLVFKEGNYKPSIKCDTHEKNQYYDADSYDVDNCIFYIPEGSIRENIDINLKGKV